MGEFILTEAYTCMSVAAEDQNTILHVLISPTYHVSQIVLVLSFFCLHCNRLYINLTLSLAMSSNPFNLRHVCDKLSYWFAATFFLSSLYIFYNYVTLILINSLMHVIRMGRLISNKDFDERKANSTANYSGES